MQNLHVHTFRLDFTKRVAIVQPQSLPDYSLIDYTMYGKKQRTILCSHETCQTISLPSFLQTVSGSHLGDAPLHRPELRQVLLAG